MRAGQLHGGKARGRMEGKEKEKARREREGMMKMELCSFNSGLDQYVDEPHHAGLLYTHRDTTTSWSTVDKSKSHCQTVPISQ